MKKAFVIILLAAGALSACRAQDIRIEQPTKPPTEAIIQEKPDPTGTDPILDYPKSTTQPMKLEQVSEDIPKEILETEPLPDRKNSSGAKPQSTESKKEDSKPGAPSTEKFSHTEPVPTETVPPKTDPIPIETKDTVSEETIPETTTPPITDPPTTVAPTTEPPTTEAPTTEPPATEPPETEPPAVQIDTYALEAYGRSYASSAYGYNGTSACTPGSGAGYFPAATKRIDSMDEGYCVIQEAVDSQYRRDIAYGYSPYEEIDGMIVRCPINVCVSPTGELNVFTITVYYGGTA